MGVFCSKCGTPLREGARFCAKCGAAVATNLSGPRQKPEYQRPKVAKAKRKTGNGLIAILTALLLVEAAIIALFGWPGFLIKEGRAESFTGTTISDGIASVDGIKVDFGSSAYDAQTLESAKTAETNLDEGAVSAAYEFSLGTIPEGNITLSFPAMEDFSLADDEKLYLDIAIAVTGEDGETFMVYDYIEAKIADGMLTAEMKPSDYAAPENCVNTTSGGVAKRTYTDKFRFNAAYTVKLTQKSQTEKFQLVYDDSRVLATTFSKEDVASFLSRMEQVYNQMEAFGFNLKARTSWPMSVYIKTMSNDGVYINWRGINSSYINLKRGLFLESDYEANATGTFAHEFTHFAQNCYVSLGYNLDWLNESSAVFFEDYFGSRRRDVYVARQYEVFDGIYPASDSAGAGYARGSLISYWAARGEWLGGKDSLSGKDKMSGLIDLYSTGGYIKDSRWHEWIDSCIGKPSEYAVDFFTKSVLADETVWGRDAYTPPVLHQQIADGTNESIKKHTKEMKLAGEKVKSEEGQILEISVPAYGARVLGLTMADGERKKLEDDTALAFSADGGAELVLIKCKAGVLETQSGGNVSAPAFVGSLKDNFRYLLLVVNPTDQKIEASVTASASEQYLLYIDSFVAGEGGKNLEEFYEQQRKIVKSQYGISSLEEFRAAFGYIIRLEQKDGESKIKFLKCGRLMDPKVELFVQGQDGIPGVYDKASNTFSGTCTDGTKLFIDFGNNKATVNDRAYSLQPA